MYARGMSVRDIQACLLEMYQVDVSEGLISQTTNGVMEEVKAWQNRSLRKVIKTKGAFPMEASVMKIFYLAIETISKKWTMPIRRWKSAMNQFAIRFGDRLQL